MKTLTKKEIKLLETFRKKIDLMMEDDDSNEICTYVDGLREAYKALVDIIKK